MKQLFPEALLSIGVVVVPTYFAYSNLAPITSFWDAQSFWNIVLGFCWLVVALGYYHQGWIVYKLQTARDVSLVLPIAVFFVQCILFVKGIFYQDWSLVLGAVLVNSGVVFSLTQILKVRRKLNRKH